MLLKNLSVLFGKELRYIPSTDVKISGQRFTKIKPQIKPNRKEEWIDCEGLILIPGLINSHTHIGDSIGKDITINSSVDERIHPVMGIKSKILRTSKKSHLITFMKNACYSMIKKGTTTFVDFREGGFEGVALLKKALSEVPIRCVILGRLEYYQNQKEVKKNHEFPIQKRKELHRILKNCDGIGLSGANENSDKVLDFYSKTRKLKAIHSAESIQSVKFSKKNTKRTETVRALLLRPHFLVHLTNASKREIRLAAKKTRGVVICPRANASLAEGMPDVNHMLEVGCNITIGTDNVMINSPDMFREMDYLWKITMGINKKRIDPREVLKMATVNASKMLRKDIGFIDTNRLADCVFIDKHSIDLEPMHNPYASIVHRVSESSIKGVMIGGKIVNGKI